MTPTITTKAKPAASRLLLFAPPKWGKTSFAAYAPSPVVLMTKGEDGLRTLINYGRLPEVHHFEDEARDWAMLLDAVHFLTHERHEYKTLVLDTLNGAARLLAEQIVGTNNFQGDWSEFDSYGRGDKVCKAPWLDFLQALEYLRQHRKMSLVLLAHAKTKTVRNAGGTDYDQFQPDLPDVLMAPTCRWADCLLFGGLDVQERKAGPGKVKVSGGTVRTILTETSPAHMVGNRFGLPRVIRGGETGESMWRAFAKAMADARPKPPAAPVAEKPAPAPKPPAPAEPATDAPPSDADIERDEYLGRLSVAAGKLGISAQSLFEHHSRQVGSFSSRLPLPAVGTIALVQLEHLVRLVEQSLTLKGAEPAGDPADGLFGDDGSSMDNLKH